MLTVGLLRRPEFTNTAWSCAKLRMSDAPLRNAIAAQARRRMSSFSSKDLSRTAWSLAALHCSDSPLLSAIASASMRRMSEQLIEQQDLANTAWAFSHLGFEHVPLLPSFASSALPRLTECSPLVITNLVWAYAALDFHA